LASGVAFGFSIATAAFGTSRATISDTLTAAIDNLLIGIIIGGAITGFGTVLFTYALQETIGRMLLLIGYASALVVGVLIFSVVGANIRQVVQQSLSGGVFNPAPINDLQARLRVLQLLNFVPALINASAYYLAWSRVNKGELPGQSATGGP
jgi:H+/gluconate symporter-like permease